jgi:hypothetical protein
MLFKLSKSRDRIFAKASTSSIGSLSPSFIRDSCEGRGGIFLIILSAERERSISINNWINSHFFEINMVYVNPVLIKSLQNKLFYLIPMMVILNNIIIVEIYNEKLNKNKFNNV